MGSIPSSAKRCVPFQFIRLNIMEIIQKLFGYGSIPINTIFTWVMNIHKYQLFWGSLGTRVLTHWQGFTERSPPRGQGSTGSTGSITNARVNFGREMQLLRPWMSNVVLLHVIMQLHKMFGITVTFNTFYCFLFPGKLFKSIHVQLDVHQNDDASNKAVAQRFKMSCQLLTHKIQLG